MFGSRSKGLFVDLAGPFALVARTTSPTPPFVVEEVREIPLAETGDAAEAIRSFAGARGGGYTAARCAVYPPNRLVARLSIDGRKLREESYLAEQVRETVKIDPNAYSLFTLSPSDGRDATALKTPPRDVLICGAPTEELSRAQDQLLELGLYPERMEIGTVASLGGVMSYLSTSEARTPTLLLEIGNETTNVFILSREGVGITRSVAFGISSMIPLVQKELALKDEESARKLFFSNSFDFTGMGPQLTKRLLRELQASIGFYEVQTGQSIGQLCCTLVPSKVGWLQRSMADVLGMRVLELDFAPWLERFGIQLAGDVASVATGAMWTSLFCLMCEYEGRSDEAAA